MNRKSLDLVVEHCLACATLRVQSSASPKRKETITKISKYLDLQLLPEPRLSLRALSMLTFSEHSLRSQPNY